MSGPTSIHHLMESILGRNCFTEDHAAALWVEVRARLVDMEATDTVEEVEAFEGRRLDTHPRDIVTNAICFVLTGKEYWPNDYPGSPFVYKFLKECISRGYVAADRIKGDCPSMRFVINSFDGVETIRQEVVPASLYDQAQVEIAELRLQVAALTKPGKV